MPTTSDHDAPHGDDDIREIYRAHRPEPPAAIDEAIREAAHREAAQRAAVQSRHPGGTGRGGFAAVVARPLPLWTGLAASIAIAGLVLLPRPAAPPPPPMMDGLSTDSAPDAPLAGAGRGAPAGLAAEGGVPAGRMGREAASARPPAQSEAAAPAPGDSATAARPRAESEGRIVDALVAQPTDGAADAGTAADPAVEATVPRHRDAGAAAIVSLTSEHLEVREGWPRWAACRTRVELPAAAEGDEVPEILEIDRAAGGDMIVLRQRSVIITLRCTEQGWVTDTGPARGDGPR
jgi:hypothetical protein